MLFLILRPSN